MGDELGSSYPNSLEDEKCSKYDKFRKEQLNKDYKFNLDMLSNSLSDLKDTIIEWSILNGRKFTFVKNESYRVRVVCKGKCDFFGLCSKVGVSHAYHLKTWIGIHTCVNNRFVICGLQRLW